jgi:uncharacterized DUF497 family protein
VRIIWDDSKNLVNRKKHGISFEQACALFEREGYLEIFDELHSEDEDRFIAIGQIEDGLVVIVHTEPDEETIRIISARWATKREAKFYGDYVEGKLP